MTKKILITAISLALLSGCNNSSEDGNNIGKPTPPNPSPNPSALSLVDAVAVPNSERMELALTWDHETSDSGVTYDVCVTTPSNPENECNSIATFTDVETGNVFIPTFEHLNEGAVYVQATLDNASIASNEIELNSIEHENIFFTQTAQYTTQQTEVLTALKQHSGYYSRYIGNDIVIRRADDTGEIKFQFDQFIPSELNHLNQSALITWSDLASGGAIFGMQDNIIIVNWMDDAGNQPTAFKGISILEFDDVNGTLTSLGYISEQQLGFNANEQRDIQGVSPFLTKDFIIINGETDSGETTNHALSWDDSQGKYSVNDNVLSNFDPAYWMISSATKVNGTGFVSVISPELGPVYQSSSAKIWVFPEDNSAEYEIKVPSLELDFDAVPVIRFINNEDGDKIKATFDYYYASLSGSHDPDLITSAPTYAELDYANLISGTVTAEYKYTQVPEVIRTAFKQNSTFHWYNWNEDNLSYLTGVFNTRIGAERTSILTQLSNSPYKLEFQDIIPI